MVSHTLISMLVAGLAACVAPAQAASLPPREDATASSSLATSGTVYVTPHSQFSSSIGVLGCKVDTNRIAYWPAWPDCTNMCVKLTFGSRSRTVLHIDSSAGAHDISFDAFQYLAFGSSATASPAVLSADAGVDMDYELVDMAECADIITSDTGKLAIIALSPNQVTKCGADSWLGQNYELRNVMSSTCQYGIDEVCPLDDATGTASCPSGSASSGDVLDQPVIDYIAPCGVEAVSGEAQPVANECDTVTQTADPSS